MNIVQTRPTQQNFCIPEHLVQEFKTKTGSCEKLHQILTKQDFKLVFSASISDTLSSVADFNKLQQNLLTHLSWHSRKSNNSWTHVSSVFDRLLTRWLHNSSSFFNLVHSACSPQASRTFSKGSSNSSSSSSSPSSPSSPGASSPSSSGSESSSYKRDYKWQSKGDLNDCNTFVPPHYGNFLSKCMSKLKWGLRSRWNVELTKRPTKLNKLSSW